MCAKTQTWFKHIPYTPLMGAGFSAFYERSERTDNVSVHLVNAFWRSRRSQSANGVQGPNLHFPLPPVCWIQAERLRDARREKNAFSKWVQSKTQRLSKLWLRVVDWKHWQSTSGHAYGAQL